MSNPIDNTIDESLKTLDNLVTEARKYVLQGDFMNRYIAAYNGVAAQLISIVSTPAIPVRDTGNKVHYMPSGEKWKLFMAATFFYQIDGNEGVKEMSCTDPFTCKFETFTIDKKRAITALNDYDSIYNQCMIKVMEINDKVASIAGINGNSEKLDRLAEVNTLFHEAVKNTRSIYETINTGH